MKQQWRWLVLWSWSGVAVLGGDTVSGPAVANTPAPAATPAVAVATPQKPAAVPEKPMTVPAAEKKTVASEKKATAPEKKTAGPVIDAETQVQNLLDQGQALQGEGKWKEAAAVFEQVLKLDPTNDVATFGLGTAYGQSGRNREGLALLERLLKKTPDHPAVMNNIAWIYAKAEDPDVRNPEKALRYARRAVIAVPSDYNVWNTLAEAYYASGDYQRALRVARQYLQMLRLAGEPDQTAAKELLARCRTAAGVTAEPEE